MDKTQEVGNLSLKGYVGVADLPLLAASNLTPKRKAIRFAVVNLIHCRRVRQRKTKFLNITEAIIRFISCCSSEKLSQILLSYW
jgi:hypothetical protein